MALTLAEQKTYSLKTIETQPSNKCIYFLKLTDSSLKAIEEHIIYRASTSKKPIIKFDGQHGVIKIPGKPGSASQDAGKSFRFNIGPLQQNPTPTQQGILECIKHEGKLSSKLVSCGPLDSKLQIAATDEAYENTRNRMAQVEQERKDIRTKEIKISSSLKQGKKARGKVVQSSATDNLNKLAGIKKKVSSSSPRIPHTNSPKPSPHPTSSSTVQYSSSPATSSFNINSPNVTSTKSFSCKDRVVHILAIRPHKKPELIARLQREASSPKDRNNLTAVLQQVSSLSENQYKLHTQYYRDLQVDIWPFYNESERLIVKRNISTQKKCQQNSSPQIVSSTSKSPEEKPGYKRPITTSHANEPIKRFKTHQAQSNRQEEPSSTSSHSTNKKNSPPPQKHVAENKHHENDSSPSIKDNCINSSETEVRRKGGRVEESPPTVASTSDTPEHLVNYKPITSYQQRCEYKRDFQLEYPEYIQLKKNVDAVTKKFIELDRSWRRTEKGTKEYERVQDEIIEAYNKQQKDEKFHEMKRRCQELHQKLHHIKRLVVEYDQSHLT